MINHLTAKTKALKFERRLSRIGTPCQETLPAVPCDCPSWLKKQVQKRTLRKPQIVPYRPAWVLIAPAAPKNIRNHAYNLRFEQGTAAWYHIPVSVLEAYPDDVIEHIRYCALGTTVAGMGERSAKYLWSVRSVRQVARHVLTVEQAGSLKASDTPYWLFELGEATPLDTPVAGFLSHFAVKVAPLAELACGDFVQINEQY